jgi:alpha-galactosidase
MGWNSYNCFGGEVTEAEVRANAEYMAKHLKPCGWEYVVIDIYWHADSCQALPTWRDDVLDGYGRLLPSVKRFPSARNGRGFKPLADYLHGLGLKFGIHVMPGIPKWAIERHCPILGSETRAPEIAHPTLSNGLWAGYLPHVDTSHPGSQAYLDSLLKLYAEWEVDLIKADGIGYIPDQVEAMDLARQRCGRDIVLSISAGCSAESIYRRHRTQHCEMWRISEDLWDKWPQLERMFDNFLAWQSFIGSGHWADGDMLPLGRIGIRQHPDNAPDRMSRLTHYEQTTLMTLWCIAQSPLMFGGDLPSNDPWTLGLITNPEVLAVNQSGRNPRELFRDCHCGGVAWTCDLPDGAKALAVFTFDPRNTRVVRVPMAEMGLPATCHVRDLWARRDLGNVNRYLDVEVPPHGARLFQVTPESKE